MQPNAPGSQGFNPYAYAANNPTLWVDPSGHGLDGYAGTLMFLPVTAAAFALAASLSTLMELTLAMGKEPEAWKFGPNVTMTQMGLTTFALVLRCALTGGCMATMRSMQSVTGRLGSTSADGVTSWSAATLPTAATLHPEIPTETLAQPMPMWSVPFGVAPWQVAPDGPEPDGDPGPGGPKWGWGKIGALIGLGALLATLLSSSGPLPSPQPNPTPAPLPTPVPTPLLTPDREPQHRGRLQIQGKDMRRGEISWPWALPTPPTKSVALSELAILWGQLSSSERELRTRAYQDAQKFIQNGPYYAEVSKSFQNRNLPDNMTLPELTLKFERGGPLLTNKKEPLVEKLIMLLNEPWDNNAEVNIDLFHQIGQSHNVTMLVSNSLSTISPRIIQNLSGRLADVEEYKSEISALYMWIEAVSDKLDEQSRGNLATAIQRHLILLDGSIALAPDIQQIMIPFLLQCLTADDWTIRNSAISSLDTLDGRYHLDKWFTDVQLAEFRRNLQVYLILEEERELSSILGRLERFVQG